MKAKIVIAAMIMLLCATTSAWADMGFEGSITYKDCDCRDESGGDRVKIWSASGQDQWYYYVLCGPTDGYDTLNDTFPPGYYYLQVVLGNSSECDVSFIQYVYHSSGTGKQVVNLQVRGPAGDPDGGDE